MRAFAADAPPAKLAFYTPPQAAIANTHQTLPRLSDLLRLGDAGLKALLNDWLEGVYTAANIDEALAARGKLTHGEVIMTREGHAVSQFAVTFYAPDSEQAGMLARAQEIENLERQLRAQALIADEARSALVRAEAAYTEASQRLVDGAPRGRRGADARAPAAGRAAAPDAAGRADQRRAARSSTRSWPRSTRQLEELDERRATGEARFEELDMQLADDAGAPRRARRSA